MAANLDATVRCGACGGTTSAANQFCSNCGNSLWEKCQNCKTAVLIGQSFCSGCGGDLKRVADERRQQAEETLSRTQSLAEEGKFAAAARLLDNLRSSTDFRLAELARRAEERFNEYTATAEHWKARLPELETQAAALVQEHDFKGVVRLLTDIPNGTMTDSLKSLRSTCETNYATIKECKQTVKSALANKHWPEAMSALTQLVQLCPKKQKYADLLTQVSGKIYAAAKELQKNKHFAEALNVLHDIPVEFQAENHVRLRNELEEIIYVRKALARLPFAAPAVDSLIQHLRKLTPDDARIDKLAEKYAKVRSTRPRCDYWLWPQWMKPEQGMLPGPIAPCGLPLSIAGSRPECLLRNGSQFWTAFGLALHGLGFGDPHANFMMDNKGKGMLRLLSRKKPNSSERVWGLDAGDSGIKAICLTRNADSVRIEQAISIPVETKLGSRDELRKADAAAIFRALKKLTADPSIASAEIVANVPGAEVFSRYLILPSDKEKLHDSFIEQEASANIPININLLTTSYLKFPAVANQLMQRATLLAIRKTEIDSRISMFKQLNLNLSALVGDPFALYLAANHFKLCLPADGQQATTAAIIVDVGHVSTNLLVAKADGLWHRTLDWGLDELTLAIAGEHKIGRVEADAWRRNPTRSPAILKTLAAMRGACLIPRRELERSLRVAKDTLDEFALDRPLLIGGGAMQPLLGNWLNGEDL